MSLFYMKNDSPYIPDRINPELVKLAKAIVKTCRLTFKFQMKTTSLNNALKTGDKEQMHNMLQKCMEKNKAIYNQDMTLSGAQIKEVDEAFFADKDEDFYKAQLAILIDFAYINCVVEGKAFPLMSAACKKTLGKNIDELYFFENQGEIVRPPEEEEEETT